MAASSSYERNMDDVVGSDSSVDQNQIEFSKPCDSTVENPGKLEDAERNKSVEEMQGKTIVSENLAGDVIVKASQGSGTKTCPGNELVGCKIKVWWPLDQMFYEGNVTSFDPSNKMHQIDYDDGDREILDLTKENWKLLSDGSLSSDEQNTVRAPGASTETLSTHGRESPRRPERKLKASMENGDASRCSGNELVGRKIKVWWPLDEMFYEGKVASFDPVNKTHQVDYDDGDHETLDLTEERWQPLGEQSAAQEEEEDCKSSSCLNKDASMEKGDASRCSGNELVGRKIKVWWPLDEMFYEGKVASFDPVNKTHQVDYDDGDHETLDLTEERWQPLGEQSAAQEEEEDCKSSSCLNKDVK